MDEALSVKAVDDKSCAAIDKPPSSHPRSASNAGHPVIEPLEMESAVEAEVQYPTGAKFAVVAMAMGLTLAIIGLVSLSFRDMFPTVGILIVELGRQHSRYGCTQHHRPLQDNRRCRLVLLCIVRMPLFNISQAYLRFTLVD